MSEAASDVLAQLERLATVCGEREARIEQLQGLVHRLSRALEGVIRLADSDEFDAARAALGVADAVMRGKFTIMEKKP